MNSWSLRVRTRSVVCERRRSKRAKTASSGVRWRGERQPPAPGGVASRSEVEPLSSVVESH